MNGLAVICKYCFYFLTLWNIIQNILYFPYISIYSKQYPLMISILWFFFNFRIEDIDNTTQLVSLYCKKTKKSLVQKVPWDQLRPIFTSDMHDVSALEDEEITPLNSTVDSVNDIILLNDKKAATEDTETIFLKEVPAKKRNPGKLQITKRVTPSTHLENSLSNIEKEGFWLTDEHIDHAQHFLADQFKSIYWWLSSSLCIWTWELQQHWHTQCQICSNYQC